jgi:MscS family membrane protein
MAFDLITIINYQVGLNEVWRYLVFLIALLMTYPLGKLIIYIVQNYLKKWATKTAFKLDDIFFNSINPSITMFVFAGLFYFGSSVLNQGQYAPVFTKAFNFFIIVPLVYFLIKFSTEMIGFYLKSDKKRINEAGIDLLMQIVRITLFLIGILLVLGNLGYNVSAGLAGLGVGGLAFALAAQDILKNFFAGVSLVFDKTFNKGERIQFQGVTGKIEELKLRSTKVRTYDGTLMTIPNAMLADNMVENVTKVPKVKVKMTIGVEYSTSATKLEEAKKIIQEAIDSNEYADAGNHDVWFDNFGAYSLDLQVIYYGKLTMDDWSKRVQFKDEINFAIKKGFEKAKISMAFPTQTIELKK